MQHTAEDLAAMRARGDSRTDWARVAATTQAELDASIDTDPDEAGMTVDWQNASVSVPQRKAVLNMRVDHDVLAFFKQTGQGYQTRINAVLRAYMQSRQQRPR